MNKIICLLLILCSIAGNSQSTTEKQKILYGKTSSDSLIADPFGKWFIPNFDSYHPTSSTVAALKNQDLSGITIKVFYGTWCGDSKREVPRFLKLLSSISFPEKKLGLIALGNGDSLVKQSPQHEEAGLGIFRVPTFIIYKNGMELNRINEYPVSNLEKDLLTIFTNQAYSPNYRSFKLVSTWIRDGSLTDENSSTRGLAEQLRYLVSNEHELNSLAYLLLKQNKKKEALKLFQVNYSLYPESSNVASSLGEGYLENGDHKKAVTILERSLELNKEPANVKAILPLLYKAKEIETK